MARGKKGNPLRHGHKRIGARWSALSGKGGRNGAALAAVVALLVPASALAAGKPSQPFVPQALLERAAAQPERAFEVIVQSRGKSADRLAADVGATIRQHPGKGAGLGRRLDSVAGVSASLTGKQILKLAARGDILAITRDDRVRISSYDNNQEWPGAAQLSSLWYEKIAPATIVIVDSGIQDECPNGLVWTVAAPNFSCRVVARVNMASLTPNSPGDGRGHGTFVASIAAGEASGHTGGAPQAKLVDIDVMNDLGMARTSDVIAACDWILANKDAYGIRVANFSLHSEAQGSFTTDPLDRAVERLWFAGVFVVASSGNYAVDGQQSNVRYAPGNDPFILTVGAVDTKGNKSVTNDFPAPWSAYGYTSDGFAKPEVLAPGRYMIGAVPPTSTMALERPDRVVSTGYMQLSGTSFAAPVASAAAAYVIGAHPTWTPDQVKGALMSASRGLGSFNPISVGMGEVAAYSAVQVTAPPNPNAGLNRFLVADPAGGPVPVFDSASWYDAAKLDASWNDASWADASWHDASWTDASWTDASWADASWADASWLDASSADAVEDLTWVE